MMLLTGPPPSNSLVITKTVNGGATKRTNKNHPITPVVTHPYGMLRQIKGIVHPEIKRQNHFLIVMLFQSYMTDFLPQNTI